MLSTVRLCCPRWRRTVALTLSRPPPAVCVALVCVAYRTADYLSNTQALANPTITYYPALFSALVPIYRLDALANSGITLVLSRNNFALIYMGLITNWADPRLQQDNPSVTLPNLGITVVYQNESLATNAVVFKAMAKFNANFTQYASTTNLPSLPVPLYYSSVPAVGVTAVPAAVVSVEGSIGYVPQAMALEMNVAIASMINNAGSTVTANANSVAFAVVELGTQTLSRPTAQMDLTDGAGSSVWPIVLTSYVMIDTANSRSTCHAREATVNFWLWFYQSSLVTGLMATRQVSLCMQSMQSLYRVLTLRASACSKLPAPHPLIRLRLWLFATE